HSVRQSVTGMSTAHQSVKSRIVSLDQFRGYTVAGMLLVNFIGEFQAVGAIWKHHNTYCSYADTIMPQFFFAVGFALRLTFLRRLKIPDPTGLQVLKKCRVSGRRHFCHPTSFQGRGCENGRSTEDPASGS